MGGASNELVKGLRMFFNRLPDSLMCALNLLAAFVSRWRKPTAKCSRLALCGYGLAMLLACPS